MADDSNKKQKGKHEAKEQRRKRQARQVGPTEKKQEKQPETSKAAPEKPAYQPPGPEFYKTLKRETDDILKISEEDGKYRNKEILSNWAKYEMPIESYEEMDKEEQLGADYEALIQAPLSVGTHFQFKHEKSWDVTSGPSPYQKYFDIDMGNLVVALSTIPFYERNSIDKSLFTDSDFLSMDHRANKYKQKYYSESKSNTVDGQNKNSESVKAVTSDKLTERCHDIAENLFKFKDIKIETHNTLPIVSKHQKTVLDVTESADVTKTMEEKNIIEANEVNEKHSDNNNIVKKLESSTIQSYDPKINIEEAPVITNDKNRVDNKLLESPKIKLFDKGDVSVPALISEESAEGTSQKDTSKPLIESPEDLEKWLDDFLDN